MSLRQSQVTLLLREMAHSAGVKVDIRHKDAHRGIALVNFLDQVRSLRGERFLCVFVCLYLCVCLFFGLCRSLSVGVPAAAWLEF